jgi:hypothetical protein
MRSKAQAKRALGIIPHQLGRKQTLGTRGWLGVPIPPGASREIRLGDLDPEKVPWNLR